MPRRPIRGAVRAVLFLSLTVALLLVYFLAMLLGRRAMLGVRRLWCAATARLLGVRIKHAGRPFTDCPTLFVANHVSYLDVLALGGFADATFIAKSEVARWPLFGLLGAAHRTMFIRRHWRQALLQRNALAARMREGESFILFGEGTSSNGLDVRPIKTSLLSVAEPWILDCPIAVQPITLAYTRLADGTRGRTGELRSLRLAFGRHAAAASLGCAAARRRRAAGHGPAIRCCPGRWQAVRTWVAR